MDEKKSCFQKSGLLGEAHGKVLGDRYISDRVARWEGWVSLEGARLSQQQ